MDDLEPDKQLKTQIMRHHIQRSFKNREQQKQQGGGSGQQVHPSGSSGRGGGGGDEMDLLAEASALLGEGPAKGQPPAAAPQSSVAAPNALEDDLYDF